MIRGLEAGTLDIAIVLTEGITKAILQGLPAKIIQPYIATPLHWGVHVPFRSDISKISDLENQTFAISREGSGSHIMAYIIADMNSWDLSKLKFNIVGDIYGMLWALENSKAQVFLWERFTTAPFVEQKKCKRIDEVVTPWPCFVIAVRKEIAEKHPDQLLDICSVINSLTLKVKNDPKAVEAISWRYNLNLEDTKHWFAETDWNYNGKKIASSFATVVDYLTKVKLLNYEETLDWEKRLFL